MGYGSTDTQGRKRKELNLKFGMKAKYAIHRLVMWAFVGEDDRLVNHKDGNTKNNHLNNLEYMTASENSQHAVDTGLRVQKGNERQWIAVIHMDMAGNYIETFPSVSEAARATGLETGRVSAICKGTRNYSNGHKFKYANPGGGYAHLNK